MSSNGQAIINEPNNNLYIKKIKLSKEYLEKNCHEQVISEKLNKIILKYRYLRKRWS